MNALLLNICQGCGGLEFKISLEMVHVEPLLISRIDFYLNNYHPRPTPPPPPPTPTLQEEDNSSYFMFLEHFYWSGATYSI